MQNIIKSFWISIGCGSGKVPPAAAAVNIASNSSKEQQKKKTNPNKDGIIINMDKCFEVGYRCVRRATAELMEDLHKKCEHEKPTCSLNMYHKWNTRIEDMLVNYISKFFPEHHFKTKSKNCNRIGISLTDDPTWFIDPIQGVNNFVHGFPFTVISVAFWMCSEPRFSIIWNPLLNQCYTARSGFGAYMNVNPLKVSKRTELSHALVMHELRMNSNLSSGELICIKKLACNANGLRSLGCPTSNMCMVAQGLADAYIDFSCPSWDISAATLLVKEAGGVVLDPSLKPFDIMSRRVLCASTQELAEKLSAILVSKNYSPKYNESKRIPESHVNTYHVSDKSQTVAKSSVKSKKPSSQSSSKEQLMQHSNKVLVTPPESSRRMYPPFPPSTKFSGYPRDNRSTKKSVSKHPTDPNFPGQGYQF